MYDVCIIGAGQSGLTTCKTFIEKNYKVIVLEKSLNHNGMFENIKEKDKFTWSTSRYMSGFSDFPMDKKLPVWFTIQNYIDYLKSYIKHFGLDKYIQYNSNVTSCKLDNNNEWVIQYNNTSLICKKLIICAGLNQTPKYPNIIQNFKGKIIHTQEVYNNMTEKDWYNTFSNKRVLLLGGGESAFDIGHIITKYTKDLYFSSKNYIEWFPTGGETNKSLETINYKCFNKKELLSINLSNPTDTQLLYNEYSLPEPMSFIWHNYGRYLLNIMNQDCPKCIHGHEKLCNINKTPDNLFKKYVTKRTDFMIDIHANKVKIVYYPDKIEGTTIYTKEELIDNIDIIVCATGFKKSFSFLDKYIYDRKFIKKIIPVDIPNIAFIGYARPTMGSIAMIAEMQSWWVLLYFEKTLNYRIRTPLFRNEDPLNLENEHINSLVIGCYYLKDLARDMNIEPNMLSLLFTDWKLFFTIYTGSCHPMIYRLNGQKYHSKGRENLLNTFPTIKSKDTIQIVYITMFVLFHIIFIIGCFIMGYIFMKLTQLLFKNNIKYDSVFKLVYIYTGLLILYFYNNDRL